MQQCYCFVFAVRLLLRKLLLTIRRLGPEMLLLGSRCPGY
jgi:hypothetical protein